MKNMSLKVKFILAIAASGLFCTLGAIFVLYHNLGVNQEQALVEKSRAILSRIKVASNYVAKMDTLHAVVTESKNLYPDGKLPESQKEKVLKSVPIYAAFSVGQEGAEKEHYQFRIAAENARNEKNKATPEELALIAKFKQDPNLNEILVKSEGKNTIAVTVPVKISASNQCLVCHGHPSTSPWGNGLDILGYKMEDMKDGDVKATFSVISSLEPANAELMAMVKEISLYGFVICIGSIIAVWLLMNGPLSTLARLALEVADVTKKIDGTSTALSTASQQLASSSQEQASSVEETSSSLEEIAGMVTSSLKSAEMSVESSKKVTVLVNAGSETMNQLQTSMAEIAEANNKLERLAKLIEEIGEKTELIDEIVFQTRLLSFNASVEAERAGEHGRGFAVVAQEVGNLAQMSGKSASEIGQIVKRSIKEAQDVVSLNREKVKHGVDLCHKTSSQLSLIHQAAQEIMSGAEQTLRSSEEQNAGVQQINQSIQLISRATQENAAAADQCASSSQALGYQGAILVKVVHDLEGVVYGGGEGSASTASQSESNHRSQNFVKGDKESNVIPFSAPQKNESRFEVLDTDLKKVSGESDPWDKL